MQGISTTVPLDMAETKDRLLAALAEQGFGVLTEIDVAATLEAKLGVTRPPLVILGACNPSLAHEALRRDPSVALLLPCNVTLAADAPDAQDTVVTAVDPRELMPGPDFADLAADASARLEAALAKLAAS